MERTVLDPETLSKHLPKLNGWSVDGSELHKRLDFANFAESLAYVNKVGDVAEAADHHPDIKFGWGYVELMLTTHDRGGVTDVDLIVARQIDQIA